MRMLQSPLSFWRAALWGSIAVLVFSVTFRHLFDIAIGAALAKGHAANSDIPSPLLPIIASAAAAILAVALGIVSGSIIRSFRDRSRAKHHIEHVDLAVRVTLLVASLALTAGLPQSRLIVTWRCSLFTVNFACEQHKQYHYKLPPDGVYDFTDGDGRHSGIYQDATDAYVQVRRTRFGWPFKTITRDVNTNAREWHVTFEVFTAGNILVCFSCCLLFNMVANLLRKFLRSWR